MNFTPNISEHGESRLTILTELIGAVCLFAGLLALSTLLQDVILHFFLLFLFLGLLTWRLHNSGRKWRDYGLRRPHSLFRTLLRLLCMLLVVNVSINLWGLPLIEKVVGSRPDLSPFAPINNNPGQLLFWLFFVWSWAAFGEEMFFRGYLITRISQLFPTTSGGTTIGLLASSLLFGASHLYQGWSGFVLMFLIGLVTGGAYLVWDRNLWVPILWHGITDTLSIYAIYRGWLQP